MRKIRDCDDPSHALACGPHNLTFGRSDDIILFNLTMRRRRFRLSPWQLLALGYLVVILVGSLLLIIPAATVEGESTSYLNALFTSVSATCVTGLARYTTATHWTTFGQVVVLVLVQVGGLGFMSFVSVLYTLFGRGMRMRDRNALVASTGEDDMSKIGVLIRRLFVGSFAFEIIGAALLCIRFIPDFGVGRGIYYSVFHSITAFCNAGFDILGEVSLAEYATDPLVSLTICGLIILGGLGFCVWGDMFDCRFRYKKFKLNTRVVLITDILLILIPAALFVLFEWNNYTYADLGYNAGDKILVSFFNSVTARTAGFYTTDPASLSASGYTMMTILMFIGGASGSTAGGIKIGTFAVIVTGMISVFRGRSTIVMGKRRVDFDHLSQALAIFAACLILVLVSCMTICAIEDFGGERFTFSQIMFECVSAMGTVGLSQGVTPELGTASTIIIMILMYFGRAGILTVVYALGSGRKPNESIQKPLENILIG